MLSVTIICLKHIMEWAQKKSSYLTGWTCRLIWPCAVLKCPEDIFLKGVAQLHSNSAKYIVIYKPEHDQTFNKTCVTSEGSDQPANLRSLISLR